MRSSPSGFPIKTKHFEVLLLLLLLFFFVVVVVVVVVASSLWPTCPAEGVELLCCGQHGARELDSRDCCGASPCGSYLGL